MEGVRRWILGLGSLCYVAAIMWALILSDEIIFYVILFVSIWAFIWWYLIQVSFLPLKTRIYLKLYFDDVNDEDVVKIAKRTDSWQLAAVFIIFVVNFILINTISNHYYSDLYESNLFFRISVIFISAVLTYLEMQMNRLYEKVFPIRKIEYLNKKAVYKESEK